MVLTAQDGEIEIDQVSREDLSFLSISLSPSLARAMYDRRHWVVKSSLFSSICCSRCLKTFDPGGGAEQTSEYIPRKCRLLQKLGVQVWQSPMPLDTKLYGPVEDLQMTRFISKSGLQMGQNTTTTTSSSLLTVI